MKVFLTISFLIAVVAGLGFLCVKLFLKLKGKVKELQAVVNYSNEKSKISKDASDEKKAVDNTADSNLSSRANNVF